MEYKKIAFIGLGLIGGSIAKAIRSFHPDIKLYALTLGQKTISLAHKEGVIENDTPLPLEEFAGMDLVFLCAPVGFNIEYAKKLAPIISGKNILLTDVGSVKNEIHKAIDELGLSGQFIGGHPMTGSEKDGFAFSSPLFLENAYYILTDGGKTDDKVFDSFKEFISSLGPIALEMTPALHDYATAAISHLPHIISASLVNLVRDNDTPQRTLGTIAAGGFKDITRISSSSPVMWQNICVENKDEILRLIDMYENGLYYAREIIEKKDKDALLSFFSHAKDYRDSMPTHGKGILPGHYDFYIDLIDEAGQIAKVAAILAEKELNIKNIGIVHNREFEDGVLHIELYDEKTKDKAMRLLDENNYTIHKRG